MPVSYRPTLDGYMRRIADQTKLHEPKGKHKRAVSMVEADPPDNNQSERVPRQQRDSEGNVSQLGDATTNLNTANDVDKYKIFLAIAGISLVWLLFRRQ